MPRSHACGGRGIAFTRGIAGGVTKKNLATCADWCQRPSNRQYGKGRGAEVARMPKLHCLADAQLRAFALGNLPRRLADLVAQHLETCPGCKARSSRWDNHSDPAIVALRRAP